MVLTKELVVCMLTYHRVPEETKSHISPDPSKVHEAAWLLLAMLLTPQQLRCNLKDETTRGQMLFQLLKTTLHLFSLGLSQALLETSGDKS